jgi:hypothetical protein
MASLVAVLMRRSIAMIVAAVRIARCRRDTDVRDQGEAAKFAAVARERPVGEAPWERLER